MSTSNDISMLRQGRRYIYDIFHSFVESTKNVDDRADNDIKYLSSLKKEYWSSVKQIDALEKMIKYKR